MAIQFHCPSCNAPLSVDDAHAGKQVKCGQCQQTCTATAAATAIQPKAAAPKPTTARMPRKRDDEDLPVRRRRVAEPSSSFAPVAIILVVVGVAAVGMTALLVCVVGIVGGFFLGGGDQRAVKPMPIAVAEAPMPVQPEPIKVDPKIPIIKGDDKKPDDKIFFDRKFDDKDKNEKVDEPPAKIKKKPKLTPPAMTQRVGAYFPYPATLAVTPVKLDAAKVTRMLPASLDAIVAGGGGRFLLFHMPSLNKVGMFDANEGKIVHYFPAPAADVKIAAGLTKLVMVNPGAKKVERWDLFTKEKELTADLPTGVGAASMALLGSASNGPILVVFAWGGPGFRGNSALLNLDDFRPIEIVWGKDRHHHFEVPYSRVSADGRLYTSWQPNQSPQSHQTIELSGRTFTASSRLGNMSGHLVPGPDGATLYNGFGRFTRAGQPVNAAEPRRLVYPSAHSDFYCAVSGSGGFGKPESYSLSLFHVDQPKPLQFVGNFISSPNPVIPTFSTFGREKFGNDRRIWFIPAADLLATVPLTNDRLELYQVATNQQLSKAGIDYLWVASQPPDSVLRGSTFRYKLAVHSKNGGLKFNLDSNPEGMSVDADGTITWKVQADPALTEVGVRVTIRDAAGRSISHTFKLRVFAEDVANQGG